MIEVIVTRHEDLECVNILSTELAGNSHDKRSMEVRNETCNLNDRWDEIYQQVKNKEALSKKMLAPWHSYQEKVSTIKKWLAEMEESLKEDPQSFKAPDDMKTQLEKYKVSTLAQISIIK